MTIMTTIKLTKETKFRLRSYEDYPKQTFNDMIIAILDALDQHATKEARRKKAVTQEDE